MLQMLRFGFVLLAELLFASVRLLDRTAYLGELAIELRNERIRLGDTLICCRLLIVVLLPELLFASVRLLDRAACPGELAIELRNEGIRLDDTLICSRLLIVDLL